MNISNSQMSEFIKKKQAFQLLKLREDFQSLSK